jgi:hypothetical protein
MITDLAGADLLGDELGELVGSDLAGEIITGLSDEDFSLYSELCFLGLRSSSLAKSSAFSCFTFLGKTSTYFYSYTAFFYSLTYSLSLLFSSLLISTLVSLLSEPDDP